MPEQLAVIQYKEGTQIYAEGEDSQSFYIIKAGKVSITQRVPVINGAGKVDAGAGDFFGIVPVMTGRRYLDSAAAGTDVTVITARRSQYEGLVQSSSAIAMKILLGFSQQIRALDEALMVHTLELAPEKPLNADDNRFVQKENTRQYPAGAVIFNEGDPGTELFIIQKGVVRIIKAEKNREIVLALLKSGEIFGEMGLLENKPRSACAVAHEDCELMAVNKDNYDQIIAQPKIVLKLTTLLADRIWFLNKQIANHRIPSLDDRLCNMLAVFLEKEDVQLSIKSHTFAFTANELLDMTGIDRQEGTTALRAIVMSGLIKMDNDRITVLHPTEVLRKDEVFWKLHR